MTSPSKYPSESRGSRARYAHFYPKTFLGVVVAFPLGIFTASIEAVSLFGSILPISILFGLIFPIAVPLITISGILLASWHLGKTIAAAKEIITRSHAVHILSHAHEIAFMGIYGILVIFSVKSLALEPETTTFTPPFSSRRQTHSRLFIHDFPRISFPVFPPTPPYSDTSYTPSRSPTWTESTDTPFSLRTPADLDRFSHTPLAQLSGLLDILNDEDLRIVASYVEILKKGRSSSSVDCFGT